MPREGVRTIPTIVKRRGLPLLIFVPWVGVRGGITPSLLPHPLSLDPTVIFISNDQR